MPELPEVETVRRQLEQEILGSKIESITVREVRCFELSGAPVKDEVVKEVKRVGKYLFIVFESGRGLQIHLKMTGRLIMGEPFYESAIHTRVVLNLKNGGKIYYWDTRMFGYIKVLDDILSEHLKLKAKLGPEPWDLSDNEFLRKLQRTGRPIKEAILDQSLLAGVGNIYANDGLWLARIDPRRKANSLKLSEVKRLRQSLVTVLKRGLATGGASDNTYRDFYGGRGTYQDEFLVYGRTGEPCNNCGTPLKRVVVGGRGTWMCNKCQF